VAYVKRLTLTQVKRLTFCGAWRRIFMTRPG